MCGLCRCPYFQVSMFILTAAFDLLDHCLLLQRISELGVHNEEIEWFKNYLSNRYHRVKASSSFSSWRLMKGGIPQGSALGSLLFLIYMNSFLSQLTNGLLLYSIRILLVVVSPRLLSKPLCAVNFH